MFRKAIETHGIPASTLTDNGMAFTTRFAGGKGGRNDLENELRRLGVTQIDSSPNHPITAERWNVSTRPSRNGSPTNRKPRQSQSCKPSSTPSSRRKNRRRPHRELPHRATPATVYAARPKTAPGQRDDTHDRVRTDRVDKTGTITLRHAGPLHHIASGSDTTARTQLFELIEQGPRPQMRILAQPRAHPLDERRKRILTGSFTHPGVRAPIDVVCGSFGDSCWCGARSPRSTTPLVQCVNLHVLLSCEHEKRGPPSTGAVGVRHEQHRRRPPSMAERRREHFR